MPCHARLPLAGANDHVVTRSDGRRQLFHNSGHYERFIKGLEDEVQWSRWMVLASCWMPNPFHALIQTPDPNLARGMQHWFSGYANGYAKRNRRTGHLCQGRWKDQSPDRSRHRRGDRLIQADACSPPPPWRWETRLATRSSTNRVVAGMSIVCKAR